MIRFILRFLGLICLAAGFILVIYDGTKSIAGNALALTNVRMLWEAVNAGSLAAVRPLIEGTVGAFAWDPVFSSFLQAPSWAVLGVLGILLMILGRRRRPLIGYAR
ncbi:MAG: hypothetical protein JOZ70_03810 [Pseudolabrys sp.]|nr:hypothetical protein [Pseudolabrys sp.]MBV9954357.1 hypothetical protein [Pseudolabrys sp.]